jgi:hypothetical protein
MAPASDDYQGFEESIWSGLSARKHLAGRKRVAWMVAQAVEIWPADEFRESEIPSVEEYLRETILYRMKSEPRYGFIWTILLSALLSQVIRLIIEWWLNKAENRVAIRRWRRRHG